MSVARSPGSVALTVSALSACLFVALFALTVRTGPGQRADISGFALLTASEPVVGLARLGRVLLPALVACGLAAALVVAARRRQWSRALAAAGLPLAVLVLATLLRDGLLPRPYLGANGYLHNTFPSAHTATVAAACVGVALVCGHRLGARMTAALAAVVVLTGWANVASLAHRPSDVLGGLLLVGAVAPWAVLLARRRGGDDTHPVRVATNPK